MKASIFTGSNLQQFMMEVLDVYLSNWWGGFIGRRIVKRLVKMSEKPICFDLFAPEESQLPKGVKASVGDVTHIEDIMAAVLSLDVTKIIHLAYVMPSECEEKPQTAVRVNILGTNNVLEAARLCKIKRVVYTSSNAYYGAQSNFGERLVNEDDFGRPYSIYSAHKH